MFAVALAAGLAGAAGAEPPAQHAPAPPAGAVGARQRRLLDGPWSFHKVTPRNAPAEPWLPATVPGCVHTDLFANGKIGDPFFRLNEKDQQWIDRESWEYRTILRVDPATLAHARVELVFAGLDTFAEVFVNGADGAVRRQHVSQLARRREGRPARRRQRDRGALPLADRAGARRLSPPRLPAAGRQRPGAGDGEHVGAQGALSLRLGLGTALRHQRHLAPGRARDLGRGAHRRRADVPEPPRRRRGRADREGARGGGRARPRAARPSASPAAAPLAQPTSTSRPGVNERALSLRIEQPRALVAERPRTAAALHARHHARPTRPARCATRAQTRIGLRTLEVVHQRDAAGEELLRQGERRAGVHEGGELDPRRQLRRRA